MRGGVWWGRWREEPSAGGGGAGDGGAAGRRPKIQSRPQSGGCFGNRERAPEPTAFCSDAPPRTTARAYLARTNVSLRRLGSTSRSIGASFDAFFDFFTIAAPTGIGTRALRFQFVADRESASGAGAAAVSRPRSTLPPADLFESRGTSPPLPREASHGSRATALRLRRRPAPPGVFLP